VWAENNNAPEGALLLMLWRSARWRGHLENLLANPHKVAKVAHHPALP